MHDSGTPADCSAQRCDARSCSVPGFPLGDEAVPEGDPVETVVSQPASKDMMSVAMIRER